MATGYVLYNQKAGNTDALESVKALEGKITDTLAYLDVLKISDYHALLAGLEPEDYIILAGGDGTVNRFANNVADIDFSADVLYYPNGTGNDFAHDLGHERECEPFSIRDAIRNLPTVTVNGKDYHFVNGVGYGIDGYCCEVGDRLKEIPGKKVNYTSIAIKGLLFHYKTTNATITVDGETHTFDKVWLAPTMLGRFYGGGMIPTPDQSRNDPEQKLSVLVFRSASKLKALMVFPGLFKGEHIKHDKIAKVFSGHEITVSFDRPVSLQIDGETILGVTSYTARSVAKVAANQPEPATAQ